MLTTARSRSVHGETTPWLVTALKRMCSILLLRPYSFVPAPLSGYPRPELLRVRNHFASHK